jgi:uncharacterized protein (DUF1810 family)
MHEPDPLDRFLAAQAAVYADALAELRVGQKRTHWMWFIFPQLRGLGHSETARYYAIASRAEAVAYSRHLVLGPRLTECTNAVLAIDGKSAQEIFGSPDDLKFRSSLTLFAEVAPSDAVFARALQKFFDAAPDEKTLNLLQNL